MKRKDHNLVIESNDFSLRMWPVNDISKKGINDHSLMFCCLCTNTQKIKAKIKERKSANRGDYWKWNLLCLMMLSKHKWCWVIVLCNVSQEGEKKWEKFLLGSNNLECGKRRNTKKVIRCRISSSSDIQPHSDGFYGSESWSMVCFLRWGCFSNLLSLVFFRDFTCKK